MPPEVKVRLSVEGTPEALAAFRSVQEQAHKFGKGAAAGVLPFSNALKGLKGLIFSVGAAFSAAALLKFGIDTAVAAREQGDLAKSLGTTASSYSALNAVRKLANAPQEALNKGLSIFADRLDVLRAKEPATVAAFKRIGLTAASFPSDDMALNLDVVARALMKYEAGGRRSALATDALGKSGKMLIPTLEKLVEIGGLEGAISYARRTGQFIDQATVDMLEALTVSMGRLKLEAGNAALQIIEGFGPEATAAISHLADTVDNQGTPAFERMGKFAGQALRGMLGLMDAAALRMEIVGKKWAIWGQAYSAILGAGGLQAQPLYAEMQISFAQKASTELDKNEKARRKVIEQGAQDESLIRVQEIQAQQRDDDKKYSNGRMQLEEYLANRKQRIIREISLEQGFLMMQMTTLQSGPLLKNDLAQVKAWEKQIADLSLERDLRIAAPPPALNRRIPDAAAKAAADHAQRYDAELAKAKAANAATEAAARASYESGATDLQSYYDVRLSMIEKNTSAELDMLTKKWKDARKLTDPKKREDALAVISAQTDVVVSGREKSVSDLTAERAKAEADLAKQRLDFEQQYLEAQGQSHAKEMSNIAEKVAAYQKWWAAASAQQRQGMPTPFEFTSTLGDKAQLKDLQAQTKQGLDAYNQARDLILKQMTAGLLGQAEGERQLKALELDRLPALQKIAELMLTIAIIAKDPEALRAARELLVSIREGVIAARAETLSWADIVQIAGNALGSWLGSGINQVKSLGDAFRSLGLSIASAIQQLIGMQIADTMVGWIPGFSTVKKAFGGRIYGPGGTDNVPIWATVDEEMIRREAASASGVRPYLERLNALDPAAIEHARTFHAQRLASGGPMMRLRDYRRESLQRYAEGGHVRAAAREAGGGEFSGTLAVELPEGLLVKHFDAYLRSPNGQRHTLDTIARYRRTIGRVLLG